MNDDLASSSSEMSVGDMSPIKFVYNHSSAAPQHTPMAAAVHKNRFPPPRYPPYHYPNDHSIPMMPPPIVPNEWKRSEPQSIQRSNPFFVLRSSRHAFSNVKYLLPCLRSVSATVCPVNMSGHGSIRLYREKERTVDVLDTSSDVVMATQRVAAAICAFGGSVHGGNSRWHHHQQQQHQTRSIFRTNAATTDARRLYEESLPRRYIVSGSHISWDAEENPPIHHYDEFTPNDKGTEAAAEEKHEEHRPILANSSSSTGGDSHCDSAKMKYKCKKCGQLKQSHNCPYQEKMQRSIGCMVYPAVNSYTAAEPGVIAPAFTEMNNFVSYDSDNNSPREEYASRDTTAPSRPSGDLHPYTGHPSIISPESLRGANFFHSPQSSLSTGSSEDPMTSGQNHNSASAVRAKNMATTTAGCKRPHEQLQGHISNGIQSRSRNAPFVAAVSLRPEHYRAVTPHTSKIEGEHGGSPIMAATDYQYPAIPLTFSERKRLSDTLFFLSKEIPSITADCAAALREARRNSEWDLAVAELLTQVVIGLFCGEGDIRLDGLHRYLLALGISC